MEGSLDTSILERAAGGDQTAWRDIVEHYGSRVHGLIRSQCRDDDLAEEITQSVFCTVAQKLGSDSGYVELGRFDAWIFRVAMNRLRDEMRRRKRQAAPSEQGVLEEAGPKNETPEVTPTLRLVADEDDREDREALREALETLGPADRLVLELRHRAGWSFKEIADELGQPIGTVLARQHRALKKLKSLLESRGKTKNPDDALEQEHRA
ncbi:MAG: sigma-70 family RNA polymerase sigma factor [Planctomycetes bacterium]|nr:sigma-70 family RNA polymerase sigma factor [Planctomycetota bacterium]NOG52983.1 sigma-70 family RNA polymerase sigma factor [Planctomycetota bacterium]